MLRLPVREDPGTLKSSRVVLNGNSISCCTCSQTEARESRICASRGKCTIQSTKEISAEWLIQEKNPWAKQCAPGGKYFLTRNATTILAFAIGKKWKVCVCKKMP